MDAKITLSFDKNIINKAKAFAESQHISLSRLTEFLYHQITSGQYKTLEEIPISDWVHELAEGKATYKTKAQNRESLKSSFYKAKK